MSASRSPRASASRSSAKAAAAKARSAAALSGLHRPDGGTIRLNGGTPWRRRHRAPHAQRQAIQIIFQNPERSLNPNQTVGHRHQRPLRLFGVADYAARASRQSPCSVRFACPRKMLDRYPRELSGGEKQRVAIARALAAHPSDADYATRSPHRSTSRPRPQSSHCSRSSRRAALLSSSSPTTWRSCTRSPTASSSSNWARYASWVWRARSSPIPDTATPRP